MDFRDVDDLNLGDDHLMDVNLCLHMNDRLGGHLKDDDRHDALVGHHKNGMDDLNDLKMGASLDVSRVNRSYAPRDRKTDANLDGNLCRRMSDRLDDHLMDDGHRDVLVGHRANVMDDLNLVVNRVNRNYVRRDQKMVVMMDASRGLHMNDLLDDQSLVDDHRDVPVGHRMNVMDDPNDLMMVVNRVNRNCVRRDRKMGGNSDVKNLHVMYY